MRSGHSVSCEYTPFSWRAVTMHLGAAHVPAHAPGAISMPDMLLVRAGDVAVHVAVFGAGKRITGA